MSSQQGTSTTTVQNLPTYAQPYAQEYLTRAEALSLIAYAPYGGTTFAVQVQNEIDGIANLALRGRNGDASLNIGLALLNAELGGSMLNGLAVSTQAMLTNLETKAQASFNTYVLPKFSPLGVTLTTGSLNKLLLRNEARFYLSNYKTERGNIETNLPVAIEYGQHTLANAEALRMAGYYDREYRQAQLEDAYKLWYDANNGQLLRLGILENAIRALVGTTQTRTTPYFKPSPLTGMMGGAATGMAVAGPVGAVVGGLLGGLGSL